jgi:hypothetical protein
MKRLLQLGLILGFGGTLALAYFAPFFEFARYRSITSVVNNGGRVEQFVVRLPADRIDSARGAVRPEATAEPETTLEHFKLRDAEGNVIGLAAKHELTIGSGKETAWLLTIPSRGTIALASTSPRAESVESSIAALGIATGQNAETAHSIDIGIPARSVAATGEFEGIAFELLETWVVTGIDADGEIRGTLHLNTVGMQST